jgi:hypothetical protein
MVFAYIFRGRKVIFQRIGRFILCKYVDTSDGLWLVNNANSLGVIGFIAQSDPLSILRHKTDNFGNK